jgi:hypothetical protein
MTKTTAKARPTPCAAPNTWSDKSPTDRGPIETAISPDDRLKIATTCPLSVFGVMRLSAVRDDTAAQLVDRLRIQYKTTA